MPSISTATRSPSPRKRGGSRNTPTPPACPVAMTSPGSSVNACEQWLMISATPKYIARCWLLDALAVDRAADREPLRVADLVGRHQGRAHRAERVERLAADPLPVAELQVARRDVVEAGVAEDVVEGVVDGATRAPVRPMTTRELRLVVDLAASGPGPSGCRRPGRRPSSATWRRSSGAAGGSTPSSAACSR